jgi:hypothetical protein
MCITIIEILEPKLAKSVSFKALLPSDLIVGMMDFYLQNIG